MKNNTLLIIPTILAISYLGTKANAITATAKLESKSGSSLEGKVTFEKVDAGTLVRAEVSGLKPGKHGFHIHEHGDCSSGDAKSAGDHFSTVKKPHGSASGDSRHTGDLENLVADDKGNAKYERRFSENALPFASVIGKAVVVHEKTDDLKTQPSGDSGGRIGCGVIK